MWKLNVATEVNFQFVIKQLTTDIFRFSGTNINSYIEDRFKDKLLSLRKVNKKLAQLETTRNVSF